MRVISVLLYCLWIFGVNSIWDGGEDKQEDDLYDIYCHYHWVWFHNSQNNQENNTRLVDDYLQYGIKVGVINIDSTWQTGFNTFQFNPDRFPDPKTMIQRFHNLGLKVTTWTTAMINIDSPNYQYAFENKFFLNNGQTVKWWKGEGSFIDYTNPNALQYWHSLIKGLVMNMGVDGFKVDGTDPHFFLLGPNVQGYAGKVTQREWANSVYSDYYYYTKQLKGTSLLMARPVDFYLNYAPRDVIFSGWVGDQDDGFLGLREALRLMLSSGWRSYVGFGSDIGGYRCCQEGTRQKDTFLRWTQLGAFNGLMENGGGGEHRPWMFDKETVDIYRKFVDIHYELITYMVSNSVEAFENGNSLMTPLSEPIFPVENWDYFFGGDIFVAPIVKEHRLPGADVRTVDFPSGSNWIDWWSNETYSGGTTVDYRCPIDIFPVFKRMGSIIPFDFEYNGLYPFTISSQPLTIQFNGLLDHSKQVIRGRDKQDISIEYMRKVTGLEIILSLNKNVGHFANRPIIIRIENEAEFLPQGVQITTLQNSREIPFVSNFLNEPDAVRWSLWSNVVSLYIQPLTSEPVIVNWTF